MTPRLAKFYAALLAAFFLPLYAFGSQLLGPYLLGVLPIMIVLGIAAHLVLTAWREGSEEGSRQTPENTPTVSPDTNFWRSPTTMARSGFGPGMCARCCSLNAVIGGWPGPIRMGYREAHPKVKAYYVQPGVVRRHWAGSHRLEINRFLSWMDRELVFIQSRRASASQEPA